MAEQPHDNTITFKMMLSPGHRARETLITTVLWVIYGYLWLPLASFVAWYFGVDVAYERVIKAGGPDELILLLLWFSIILLVALLVIVSWSGLQYSRFRGDRERRTEHTVMDPVAERELWELDEATYARMKTRNVLTVSMDEDAHITEVRSVLATK